MVDTALQLEDITGEQKTKLEALRPKFQEKMQSLRRDGGTTGTAGAAAGGGSGDMREKFQAIQKEMRSEVEAVLTEDQKKSFNEKLSAMPQRGGRGGAGGGQNKNQ